LITPIWGGGISFIGGPTDRDVTEEKANNKLMPLNSGK
jgi:hypothetical protein